MNTIETLRGNLIRDNHNYQKYKLKEIELADVITHLLDYDFVVEIDGYKYDIEFGYDVKNKYITYCWSASPSPNLCSYEILEKAFKDGKWYKVLKENNIG